MLLTSHGIPIGLLENPFTVCLIRLLKNPVALHVKSWMKTEIGWTWTRGSTTTKDTWTETWGDEEHAVVKDGADAVSRD